MQEIHDRIWRFREGVKEKFPPPTRQHSRALAFTEIAEVVDSLIREEAQYLRTHEKHSAWQDELAQCAFNLFTALGPDYEWRNGSQPMESSIPEVAYGVFHHYYFQNNLGVEQSILEIASLIDLPALIDREIERISAKIEGIVIL